MNKPLYIGLSGVAGSGKDTFFSFLKSTLQSNLKRIKRYSFGDCLKQELNPWTTENYDIDSLDCSRDEKDFIRPLLIAHAAIKREMTKGQHWINCVEEQIKNDPEDYDVICLTDVRYNFYENDECAWVKEKGGIIVHISRFLSDKDCFLEPKNPEEKAHDPLVKNCADYEVIVEEKQSKEAVQNETLFAVEGLLKWMEENGKWKI